MQKRAARLGAFILLGTAEGIALTIVNGNSPPNVINQVGTGGVDMADNGRSAQVNREHAHD